MGLHGTWQEEVWLWRGQSRVEWLLEPGIHTRLRNSGFDLIDENVGAVTAQLLTLARARGLHRVENLDLPDLALLAHLQHHGAATALLDVTVDPLVALWMTVNASAADPAGHDTESGNVFAIRRPPRERWLEPLDSRSLWDPAPSPRGARADITSALARTKTMARSNIYWYRPPDISERLRIQRGSFILGSARSHPAVTIDLDAETGTGWLAKRVNSLGRPGKPAEALTDVAVFRIPPRLKAELRGWLEERAGLTLDVVFPTPWHNPFLEQFSRTYGRHRPLAADLGA